MVRAVSGQPYTLTPGNWDAMIPHFVQNVSPNGRAILHQATHPNQPMRPSFSTSAGEMEALTVQLLASFTNSPSWENSVSFVNEHHQTLAHLAVLFRYTTLLEKVAQWGINVDVQDVNGFTALHCAYLCGDLDSVRILKGYGADEDVQDCLGRRPSDMYIPREKGSPPSHRTSSSVQIPGAISDDWENLSAASGSLGDYESIPASREQQPHAVESTTGSKIVPALIPMPSPRYYTSPSTDEVLMNRFSGLKLHDSPTEIGQTPLSPHFPNVPVVPSFPSSSGPCPPAKAHQDMTTRPQERGQSYSGTPSSKPTPRLSVAEAHAPPSRGPEATGSRGAVCSKARSDGSPSTSPPPLTDSISMPVPCHYTPALPSPSSLNLQTGHSSSFDASCHPISPCPGPKVEPTAEPVTRPSSAGRTNRLVPPVASGLAIARSSVCSDAKPPQYEKGPEIFTDDKKRPLIEGIDEPEENKGVPVGLSPGKGKGRYIVRELENLVKEIPGDQKGKAFDVHEGNLFCNLRPGDT